MSESALKAFELLFFLAKSGHLSLARLARETGWDKATALRYLTAMEKRGVVERQDGDWALGLALVELASRVPVSQNIASRAEPILKELAVGVDETASLSAQVGSDVMYVAKAEGKRALRLRFNSGDRLPLYCTAAGKSILSRMTASMRSQYLADAQLVPVAPRTITDPHRLAVEIDETIRRGWAVDDEELEPGLVCYAMPLDLPRYGFTGAVSVSGPSGRMHQARDEVLAALRWAITRLQNELGGSGPDYEESSIFGPGRGGFKNADWHRPGSETYE